MSRLHDEEQAPQRGRGRAVTPARRNSAVGYLIILVSAAFLLLLLALLMQRRTADSIQGLHESVNSLQSIDQLIADNQELHDQVDALRESRDIYRDQLRVSENKVVQLEAELRAVKRLLEEAQAPSPDPDAP